MTRDRRVFQKLWVGLSGKHVSSRRVQLDQKRTCLHTRQTLCLVGFMDIENICSWGSLDAGGRDKGRTVVFF